MNKSTSIPPTSITATVPQLLRATAGAFAGAGLLLVTVVMPAEYGRDPTGIGKALGLTALSEHSEPGLQPASDSATDPAKAATAQEAPFKAEAQTLTLQPGEGAEIKALMRRGESFVFSWTTDGGPVNFDMHGEPPGGGDEFSSYWRDRGQTGASGSFTAPFDGTHGWYWSNKGTQPVTITVKVSGYFEKLYRPE